MRFSDNIILSALRHVYMKQSMPSLSLRVESLAIRCFGTNVTTTPIASRFSGVPEISEEHTVG